MPEYSQQANKMDTNIVKAYLFKNLKKSCQFFSCNWNNSWSFSASSSKIPILVVLFEGINQNHILIIPVAINFSFLKFISVPMKAQRAIST